MEIGSKSDLDIFVTADADHQKDNLESFLDSAEQKDLVRNNAEHLAVFLHDALTHVIVPAEFRRYLIL